MNIPALIAGLLDLVLMFLVVRAIFGSRAVAAAGTLLLLLEPHHFVYSVEGGGNILVIPCVLGWMLGLTRYERDPDRRWIFLSTFLLGLALQRDGSNALALITWAGASLLFLWRLGRFKADAGYAVAGFALPFLPVAIWQTTTQPVLLASIIPHTYPLLSNLPTVLLMSVGLIRAVKFGSPIDQVLTVCAGSALLLQFFRGRIGIYPNDGFVVLLILLASVTIDWMIRSRAGQAVLLLAFSTAVLGFGQFLIEYYK